MVVTREKMTLVRVIQGMLEGERLPLPTGGEYFSFKGIPYAAPPKGERRFRAPEPPQSWSSIREAKRHGPVCPQVDIFTEKMVEGDEDCLYLNVYSKELNPLKPAPVMFWIHGGAWTCGYGDSDLYGPELLLQSDVIVVTFNYRVGPLGFLCLNNADVPGNAGMKDQVAALRWVRENIGAFGGDADNITIFGESAGAASVAFHLTSPMSKGLFKRAILQSGTAHTPWAVARQPEEKAFELGRQLGIATRNNQELIDRLRTLPSSEFTSKLVPTNFQETSEVTVVIHWNVAEEHDFGQERFHAKHFTKIADVPVMVGYTAHEGTVFIQNLELQAQKFNTPGYTVPSDVAWQSTTKEQMEIGERIRQYYFGDKVVTTAEAEKIVQFYSFQQFIYGVFRFLNDFKRQAKSNVFLYRFTCLSERNIMAVKFLGKAKDVCGMDHAIAHADDLPYIFNMKYAPLDFTSHSFAMIRNVVKLWSNFATFGNPTPNSALGLIWPPYTLECKDFLDIGEKLIPGSNPEGKDVEFWDQIYKLYN